VLSPIWNVEFYVDVGFEVKDLRNENQCFDQKGIPWRYYDQNREILKIPRLVNVL
jgi:hypothetical protein